jgi:superfamily I DNA/RNA helicase
MPLPTTNKPMKKLTSEQKQAILAPTDKHCKVTAVAGAGKTTVLEQRARFLLKKGIQGQLIITFTKKAAVNLQNRLGELNDKMFIGTFHSFCFRLLKQEDTALPTRFITEADEFKLYVYASQAAKRRKLRVAPAEIIEQIGLLFKQGLVPGQWPKAKGKTALNRLAADVYAMAHKDGLSFFEELLTKTRDLLRGDESLVAKLQKRFPVIMVDEFQDTDDVQAEILKLICGSKSKLFVVGDSAQSIYSWRGCNPAILDNFASYFGECSEIVLDTNFRSNDTILEAANQVLSDMKSATRMSGVKGDMPDAFRVLRFEDDAEEAKQIVEGILEAKLYDSTAILYRGNQQSGLIESELAMHKIPFSVSGNSKSFFDMPEIKPLLAYMKLSLDIKDVDSLRYIWNKPTRFLKSEWVADSAASGDSLNALEIIRAVGSRKLGTNQRNALTVLGRGLADLAHRQREPIDVVKAVYSKFNYKKHIADLAERSSNREVDDINSAVRQFGKICRNFRTIKSLLSHVEYTKNLQKEANERGEGVTMSTIHSSKGLEFPIVYLIGAEEGIIPHEKSDDFSEEQRLMYVALTRAEDDLTVSYYELPSRYIKRLLPNSK